MSDSTTEINNGERFAFGKNWSQFLEVLDEDRIHQAEVSLQSMLNLDRLDGLTFLDAGSGSGLFSLAAWRLGATVHSFDYDAQSVATTKEMRRRYCNDPTRWHVESGSVLDKNYLRKLGQFDIVYSWGVLHHTGSMWQAMNNIATCVAENGQLFIAIYNDQNIVSKFWLKVKRVYCSGRPGETFIKAIFLPTFALAGLLNDIANKNNPLKRYTDYRSKRGMSLIHDWIDWFGGLPFEVAKPEEIFNFHLKRGFSLKNMTTCQTLGCNEFVFSKDGNETEKTEQ